MSEHVAAVVGTLLYRHYKSKRVYALTETAFHQEDDGTWRLVARYHDVETGEKSSQGYARFFERLSWHGEDVARFSPVEDDVRQKLSESLGAAREKFD